jgi:hypothetical protein
MARNTLALRRPDEAELDFTRFPRRTFRVASEWFRQHHDRASADRGAWYFASYPVGGEGSGRFDLVEPNGTCYLASTDQGALNELVGPDCARRGWVDADLVAGRVLSRLPLPQEVMSADTTSTRAGQFRLTNELPVTERYDLTQAWAAAFHRRGFGGVHHVLRFTPGYTRGLSLFGAQGAPDPPPPGDPDPTPAREAAINYGIEVVDPPSYSAVTIVMP